MIKAKGNKDFQFYISASKAQMVTQIFTHHRNTRISFSAIANKIEHIYQVGRYNAIKKVN